MPNNVSDMKAAKVYNAVLDAAKSITFANGYNTQPMVVENRDAYNLESYKHIIEVYEADPYLTVVPHDADASLTLLIDQGLKVVGWAAGERGDVMVELHKLMQDTLAAIHGAAATICAAGGSCGFQISSVVTDQGLLFNRGTATFDFTVTVRYFQDASW